PPSPPFPYTTLFRSPFALFSPWSADLGSPASRRRSARTAAAAPRDRVVGRERRLDGGVRRERGGRHVDVRQLRLDAVAARDLRRDRKSTRLNSSHSQ